MIFKKLKKKLKNNSAVPVNEELYSRVKSEAKDKFKDDYPSAYASAWIVNTYKKRGGTYR